jgi:hypothetical protein
MYSKDNQVPFFHKGSISQKLLGGVKGLARVLDEPVVQSGIGLISPEIGAGLAVAKRTGLLEKVKNL